MEGLDIYCHQWAVLSHNLPSHAVLVTLANMRDVCIRRGSLQEEQLPDMGRVALDLEAVLRWMCKRTPWVWRFRLGRAKTKERDCTKTSTWLESPVLLESPKGCIKMPCNVRDVSAVRLELGSHSLHHRHDCDNK